MVLASLDTEGENDVLVKLADDFEVFEVGGGGGDADVIETDRLVLMAEAGEGTVAATGD